MEKHSGLWYTEKQAELFSYPLWPKIVQNTHQISVFPDCSMLFQAASPGQSSGSEVCSVEGDMHVAEEVADWI